MMNNHAGFASSKVSFDLAPGENKLTRQQLNQYLLYQHQAIQIYFKLYEKNPGYENRVADAWNHGRTGLLPQPPHTGRYKTRAFQPFSYFFLLPAGRESPCPADGSRIAGSALEKIGQSVSMDRVQSKESDQWPKSLMHLKRMTTRYDRGSELQQQVKQQFEQMMQKTRG